MTESIPPFNGYIFDLDGTIYLSDRLIPGAAEAVARLRRRGARCVFLSNKPLQTRGDYAVKLKRLGIPVEDDDVINSSFAMARHLVRTAPGARVYVIGEPPLVREIEAAGMQICDDPEAIEFVVCAFDRTFHYGKAKTAYNAIMNGARIWATNPDRTCPVEGGELPDCAGIIAHLEAVTEKKCELIAGKPSRIMMEICAERLGLPLDQCLLVGDRLETDMVMGRNAGCKTALVLTGVTTRETLDASDARPDYVIPSVASLQ